MTYQFAVDLFHLTLFYTLPALVWFEYFHKFINPWKRVKLDYLLVSMAHLYVILLQSFNKWGDLILHSSIKENNFELFAMYIKKQPHICIYNILIVWWLDQDQMKHVQIISFMKPKFARFILNASKSFQGHTFI